MLTPKQEKENFLKIIERFSAAPKTIDSKSKFRDRQIIFILNTIFLVFKAENSLIILK